MAKKTFKEKVDYILNSPKVFKGFIYVVIAIVVGALIIWFVNEMIDINRESEEINQEISDNKATCDLMTDSYHKCKYSYSEKRCICKER